MNDREEFRFSLRTLLLLICGAAILFAAFGGLSRSYKKYAEIRANGEQVYNQDRWPADLITTQQSFGAENDLGDVQVWQLRMFYNVWRAKVSPQALAKWQQVCGATSITAASVPTQFWKMPAPWWHPQASDSAQFFMTPGFSPYSQYDDNLACVGLYDPEMQTLYVWSQFDF